MYELLYVFFIYAFLGWCTEVCFAAITTGRFSNRGFLNGPVCPIYGFGVLLVVYLLEPLSGTILLLFAGSVILTSLLELAVGFLLEKLFHQQWWNYSNYRFSIGGYVCLRFSLMWGVACLVVVKLLHPAILWLIDKIPYPLGMVLLILFSLAMAVDMAATIRTIAHMNRSLGQIDALAGRIRELSDELGENLADRTLSAKEAGIDWREDLSDWKDDLSERKEQLTENLAGKLSGLKENLEDWRDDFSERREEWTEEYQRRSLEAQMEVHDLHKRLDEVIRHPFFGENRLLRAFPKMRSTNHKSALERLQKRLDRP